MLPIIMSLIREACSTKSMDMKYQSIDMLCPAILLNLHKPLARYFKYLSILAK